MADRQANRQVNIHREEETEKDGQRGRQTGCKRTNMKTNRDKQTYKKYTLRQLTDKGTDIWTVKRQTYILIGRQTGKLTEIYT
jgi:hypothetical protein